MPPELKLGVKPEIVLFVPEFVNVRFGLDVFTVMHVEFVPNASAELPAAIVPPLATLILVFVALTKRTVAVLLLTPVTLSLLSSPQAAKSAADASTQSASER